MTNIQLLPTDELVKEVCSRFDSAVFIGAQKSKIGGPNDSYGRMFRGDALACLGLCELMKNTIINNEANNNNPS